MTRYFVLLICVLLAGCGTPIARTIPVNVAVPIKCKATMPVRPVMPTELIGPKAKDFEIARAALAEISFREAYEIELVAELKSCL